MRMTPKDYMLAIDQGTTGTTVLVVNRDAAVVARASAEFSQHYPRPGWVEHDAEEIWRIALQVVAEALRNAGITACSLHSVGITNQRETTVLWNRRTGCPVGPAIVWQDRRTAQRCLQLKEEGLEGDWQSRTGLLIDPYFSATKIQWMLETIPGLRIQAENGEIAFGTIDSWLIWNLTGGRQHITDITNASRTMLFKCLAAWERPRGVCTRRIGVCGRCGHSVATRWTRPDRNDRRNRSTRHLTRR